MPAVRSTPFFSPSTAVTKTATIVPEFLDEEVHIFKPLAALTQAVVKIATEPLNPSELPKMVGWLSFLLGGLLFVRYVSSKRSTPGSCPRWWVAVGLGWRALAASCLRRLSADDQRLQPAANLAKPAPLHCRWRLRRPTCWSPNFAANLANIVPSSLQVEGLRKVKKSYPLLVTKS